MLRTFRQSLLDWEQSQLPSGDIQQILALNRHRSKLKPFTGADVRYFDLHEIKDAEPVCG